MEDLNEDPSNGIKKYRVVFAEGKGGAWDKHNSFKARKGIELEGVEEVGKEKTSTEEETMSVQGP
jgi:hypothetical protein